MIFKAKVVVYPTPAPLLLLEITCSNKETAILPFSVVFYHKKGGQDTKAPSEEQL